MAAHIKSHVHLGAAVTTDHAHAAVRTGEDAAAAIASAAAPAEITETGAATEAGVGIEILGERPAIVAAPTGAQATEMILPVAGLIVTGTVLGETVAAAAALGALGAAGAAALHVGRTAAAATANTAANAIIRMRGALHRKSADPDPGVLSGSLVDRSESSLLKTVFQVNWIHVKITATADLSQHEAIAACWSIV